MIYHVDVNQLAGSFVVEIGFRQAWPFLGLCDNRSTPAKETRLIIDASSTIEAATVGTGSADDDVAWLTAAVALNGETIDDARVDDGGTLYLLTASGHALVVSGEPEPSTVGEAWRLSGWHPA